MRIKIDSNNVVVSWCTVGDIDGGIAVNDIPDDVQQNCSVYKYINSEFIKDTESELMQAKNNKLLELSSACERSIISGFTISNKHYSFTPNDQTNITAWAGWAKEGKSVPYHADGEICHPYTSAEFLQVAGAATYYKVSQQTYYNCIKQQVLALTDVANVNSVQYGLTTLIGVYKDTYDSIMAVITSETAI